MYKMCFFSHTVKYQHVSIAFSIIRVALWVPRIQQTASLYK